MPNNRIWGTLDPFLEPGPIMGRNVANASYLDALVASNAFQEHHFYLPGGATVVAHRAALAARYPKAQATGRFTVRDRRELPQGLAEVPYHCFHLSDCINHPAQLGRLRNLHAPHCFPITSVTHSLSYPRYMAAFLAHLSPSSTARDCVVATSRTGKAVVEGYYALLRANYGLTEGSHPAPSVEIVPLGVDTHALAPPSPTERKAARQALGIADDVCAVLVLGRLSLASKMDLAPLLRAFGRIKEEESDLAGYHLVLAGFCEPGDTHAEELTSLARTMGLAATLVESPDEAGKRRCYAAADVFCSPVDNPQETFGLTLLEAAAMELPVVASDYDGYKDLVRDGETGILVPTLGGTAEPEPELTALLALLPENHGHLLLAQRTAVEVPALARALAELAKNPERREAMGRAARTRVLTRFTWQRVVQGYLVLWDELWTREVREVRDVAGQATLDQGVHPLELDYGKVFGSYPTRTAAEFNDSLKVSRLGEALRAGGGEVPVYTALKPQVDPAVLRVLLVLARKPVAARKLMERLAERCTISLESARTHVLHALKQDLLERT